MSKYGCHGKPAQSPDATYAAQAGWATFRTPTGDLVRTPRHVEIKSAFGTIGCQYKESLADPDCRGCQQARETPP